MQMTNQGQGRSYDLSAFIYVLSGIAVGAGLGLLFAPAAGKETRKNLQTWLKEKRDQSRKAFSERKQHISVGLQEEKEAFKNAGNKMMEV